MTRKDTLAALGWSLLSFVLCGVRYWFPPLRYFDEIYYPRSAVEYLTWQPQYEWTHPPLTKLLIAFSMLLFGGAHSPLGDSGYGWRFLNLVVGAALVYLVYVFTKRITNSSIFASIAAAFLVFDGFHFTQSRIATPEITVAFFSLLILYAFYRYWSAVSEQPQPETPRVSLLVAGAAASIAVGAAFAFGIAGAIAHQSQSAILLVWAFATCALYAAFRLVLTPRPAALGWLWLLAVACGLGAASKWNDLFDLVLVFAFAIGIVLLPRPKWRLPLDAFAAIVLSTTIALYVASYIPFFLTNHPATFETRHDLSAMMDLQTQMFTYHDVTVTHNAPHPYSSKWWEWPILYQPIAYWYNDARPPARATDPNACCVTEILSLPNPLTWWFGLLSIPLLGVLAWTRKNKAYLLLFAAYFAQWLPWIASPRMLFQYHFFPNDAIIMMADAIALQWIWERAQVTPEHRELAKWGIGIVLAMTLVLFVYFYPILAGDPISYATMHSRLWFPHWVVGPG
ncbi:MAG TPA: phospholipid carrier-dependent glycosyltransferase [Candidatus Baltobacteraceae bacterium]|nr:phospholipid carrier-dependent glycosyltransferase [Candidatus Baltobacteraceae bacterium]